MNYLTQAFTQKRIEAVGTPTAPRRSYGWLIVGGIIITIIATIGVFVYNKKQKEKAANQPQ